MRKSTRNAPNLKLGNPRAEVRKFVTEKTSTNKRGPSNSKWEQFVG